MSVITIPGFAELKDNIRGSISSLTSNASNVPQNPEFKQTESIIAPSSWIKLPAPYTFSVVGSLGAPLSNTAQGPSSGSGLGFTDFQLPIAPQNITQAEEFAISIRPTQGGTTVTHSGNRYKTLSIKGTTGVHAFKGAGGALKSTGEAIFQPKDLKHKSGYEVFLRLRNWFRAYYEQKKDFPIASNNLRLVFKNFKDGEFLIVECLKFEMIRQASNPFLYNYELEFKVLGHLFSKEVRSAFETDDSKFASALEKLDLARGVFLRSGDILRQVEGLFESTVIEPLRKVSLILKTAVALPTVAADIGKNAISKTVSVTDAIAVTLGIAEAQAENKLTGNLDPRIAAIKVPTNFASIIKVNGSDFINSFGEGLMALKTSAFPNTTQLEIATEQNTLSTTPRSFFEDLIVELTRVKSNAEDFFNLGDSALDLLFGRTATLVSDITKVPTPDELELLNALNETTQALNLILSTESLLKASFEERLESLSKNFEDDLGFQNTPAVKQITLPSGVTLEKLAQIHLGDSRRWGELAELNELKTPYLTDDLSSMVLGVLKPGDRFLVPADVVNGFSQIPSGKQTAQNKGLSALELSLGTDFLLSKDSDLIINSRGDISLVSSVDNIVQAVKLKLAYEKGDLMRFPELGVGIVPGVKFPPLFDIQSKIIDTLRQDDRIEGIEDLRLERLGSELRVTFNLKIKSVDLKVPLTINLT